MHVEEHVSCQEDMVRRCLACAVPFSLSLYLQTTIHGINVSPHFSTESICFMPSFVLVCERVHYRKSHYF